MKPEIISLFGQYDRLPRACGTDPGQDRDVPETGDIQGLASSLDQAGPLLMR